MPATKEQVKEYIDALFNENVKELPDDLINALDPEQKYSAINEYFIDKYAQKNDKGHSVNVEEALEVKKPEVLSNLIKNSFDPNSACFGKKLDLKVFQIELKNDEFQELMKMAYSSFLTGTLYEHYTKSIHDLYEDSIFDAFLSHDDRHKIQMDRYKFYMTGTILKSIYESSFNLLDNEDKQAAAYESYVDILKGNVQDNHRLYIKNKLTEKNIESAHLTVYADSLINHEMSSQGISEENMEVIMETVLSVQPTELSVYISSRFDEVVGHNGLTDDQLKRLSDSKTPQKEKDQILYSGNNKALTRDDIAKAVNVIKGFRDLHAQRPWYQRFFGYFGAVGRELTQIEEMKTVLVRAGVDRAVLDRAIEGNETPERVGIGFPIERVAAEQEREARINGIDVRFNVKIEQNEIEPNSELDNPSNDLVNENVNELGKANELE